MSHQVKIVSALLGCAAAMLALAAAPANATVYNVNRTIDGGATASTITPSSAPIFAAAYSSPTRVVGVGVGGTTVVSGDGGATFASASHDVGGQYSRLRSGPAGLVYAAGANGTLALSKDGGITWSTLATQTSARLRDASFASASIGYALDETGGLQLTSNGGASWRTLDPGTSRPANSVAAVAGNSVLLVGPVGIYRSVAGGRFNPVGGRVVSKAHVAEVDIAGSATFAYGLRSLIRSTDGGGSWSAVKLPLTNKKGKSRIAIRDVSFVNASSGMLLDTTPLDLAALAWFLVVWLGYGWIADHVPGRPIGLNHHMVTLRQAGMERMLERDNRIVDSQLVGHTIHSVTFFASTTATTRSFHVKATRSTPISIGTTPTRIPLLDSLPET